MDNTEIDLEARRTLVRDLVELRKDWGVRQIDVAEKMGIGQPSVSEFERGETDPKMSTIQRYARAIGYRVTFQIEKDVEDE